MFYYNTKSLASFFFISVKLSTVPRKYCKSAISHHDFRARMIVEVTNRLKCHSKFSFALCGKESEKIIDTRTQYLHNLKSFFPS